MLLKYVFAAPVLIAGSLELAQTAAGIHSTAEPAIRSIDPSTLSAIGVVDRRYQSYNLEMVEVMGGKWWALYGEQSPVIGAGLSSSISQKSGVGAAPFRYQSPIDLTNQRLRKLAGALGPAYIRVSDT